MKKENNLQPFRHPYGDCISNLTINALIKAKLPFYPIFAYSLAFEYIPQKGKLLGDSIFDYFTFKTSTIYYEPIYHVYGIESYYERKSDNREAFLERVKEDLKISNVACLIDAYYDPSTIFANLYQKKHTRGHGRLITKMDLDFIYYYAMDANDSVEQFKIKLEDFYLSCRGIIRYKYPDTLKDKEKQHVALKEILFNWFVDQDYQKMIGDLTKFSVAVRSSTNLGSEIEHHFEYGKIPFSHLFGNLEIMWRSRGATIVFIQGYMDEFGNNAYQIPIQYLKKSMELWKAIKRLLVKYGIAPAAYIQNTMADYLLEICDIEKEAILMIRNIISREMSDT